MDTFFPICAKMEPEEGLKIIEDCKHTTSGRAVTCDHVEANNEDDIPLDELPPPRVKTTAGTPATKKIADAFNEMPFPIPPPPRVEPPAGTPAAKEVGGTAFILQPQ